LDIHVYWNILTMHGPINVKSPNNTSKWQMGFNSAFKGLKEVKVTLVQTLRLCTGRTAPRGSRSIALLFHDQLH
jgi:hypothetical protein